MKKKTNRKRLDEKCLKIWSQIVRLPQICCVCGKRQSELNKIVFQGHHVVSRRYSAGRYCLENGVCICQGCHFWEKVDPEKFRDSILDAIGEEEYDELKAKYMRTEKISEYQLELIFKGLNLEYAKRAAE